VAVSHVKSNVIADWAATTVTVANSTGGTNTVNASDLVRPSDWNSAHAQYVTISGNTAGTANGSGTNLVFGGSNDMTLQLSTSNDGGQTLWFNESGRPLSFYEPYIAQTGTAFATVDSRTTYWQPMVLDYDLAFKWVDCIISASAAAPAGSSSNTNQYYQVGYTHWLSLFKRRDYAASSGSLTYMTHGSFVMTYRMQQETANMSATMSMITDTAGGTVQAGTTSNAAANLVAAVNGPRIYRIPFVATTLTAGEYWIAQARSSSGASTSGSTLSNAYLISGLYASPISLGLSGLKMHSATVATTAHLGSRWPMFQGVANAHTSNADMNATAISNGTISYWLVNFANF
jgi:hypothetical protein